MTVNDLRLTEVQISHELSWERTAQDLVWEVIYNRDLRGLVSCAHVVISFNAAGAFLYSRGGDRDLPCRLLFDPEVVEGMWEQGYPGRMVGYSSCLTAGIAKEVMLAPEEPNIRQGICAGFRRSAASIARATASAAPRQPRSSSSSQSAPSSPH
jgi:hypothetical protein